MREVRVALHVDGTPVDSEVADAWAKFLNGGWTRTSPTEPGRYLVANPCGDVVGEVFVFWDVEAKILGIRGRHLALCTVNILTDQGIWWWNVRVPEGMPSSPPRSWGKNSSHAPNAIPLCCSRGFKGKNEPPNIGAFLSRLTGVLYRLQKVANAGATSSGRENSSNGELPK